MITTGLSLTCNITWFLRAGKKIDTNVLYCRSQGHSWGGFSALCIYTTLLTHVYDLLMWNSPLQKSSLSLFWQIHPLMNELPPHVASKGNTRWPLIGSLCVTPMINKDSEHNPFEPCVCCSDIYSWSYTQQQEVWTNQFTSDSVLRWFNWILLPERQVLEDDFKGDEQLTETVTMSTHSQGGRTTLIYYPTHLWWCWVSFWEKPLASQRDESLTRPPSCTFEDAELIITSVKAPATWTPRDTESGGDETNGTTSSRDVCVNTRLHRLSPRDD